MFKSKLKRILLIDDNEADNFLHERVIRKANCAEHIIAKESAIEALAYLQSAENGVFPQPDLIFLDINMPGMNGWEFLEEYDKLDKMQKARIVLVMLTTSLNQRDEEKSKEDTNIDNFMHKPLTNEMLVGVFREHFPEIFAA